MSIVLYFTAYLLTLQSKIILFFIMGRCITINRQILYTTVDNRTTFSFIAFEKEDETMELKITIFMKHVNHILQIVMYVL